MIDEITKSLFPYDAKFFKGLFDKYMKEEDYSKDLKCLQNTRKLIEEIISKENGLNFYIDENYDENFLKKCKLPYFKKLLKYMKYIEDLKENEVKNKNVDNENMIDDDDKEADIQKEKKTQKKNICDYFIFNKKINVINNYRMHYYCSNIIQSIPSLTYLSVIKIYLQNYPLKIFLTCIYFYTFVTYVCDRDNVIDFLEALFFSLMVTIGCICLTIVHYIKENRINSITSKFNHIRKNYICRNFIKHNVKKKKMLMDKFESKKTMEIKKYSKYFFLKSFLNRVNSELYDYEHFKDTSDIDYIPFEVNENNFNFDSDNLNNDELEKENKYKINEKTGMENNEDLEIKNIKMKNKNDIVEEYKENKVNVEKIFLDKEKNNNKMNENINDQLNINDKGNTYKSRNSINNNKVNINNPIKMNDSENVVANNIDKDTLNKESNIIIFIDEKKKNDLLNYIYFENNIYYINGKNLLVGDIVYLFKGDIIPADGILLKGNNMIVDESNLTNSLEKKKKKKISLDEYTYEMEKMKKKKISVDELKKKTKMNYFEMLNLKVKMKIKKFSEDINIKKNSNIGKNNDTYIMNDIENNENVKKCGDLKFDSKKIFDKTTQDEKINNITLHNNNNNKNNCCGYDNNELYEKYDDVCPLLLSESSIIEGSGIMITTCVGKYKQMFYYNCIKKIESSTRIENLINRYSKNMVILIIFCCSICILFIFIHFLINLIENDMQTFAYNLLMFLLNTIILEILKYLLLSIDQMPLLLQNCLALYSSKILKENFIINTKNTFENILFSNTIFIDINRYMKYKCVYFFFNTQYTYSFVNKHFLYNTMRNQTPSFKIFNRDNDKQIRNTLCFHLLIECILTTSNMYQYNEYFLDIDMCLIKFMKNFQINVENYFVKRHNIIHFKCVKEKAVFTFILLNEEKKKNLYIKKNKIQAEKQKGNDIERKESEDKIMRIFIKGHVDYVLPKCKEYLDGDTQRGDIEKIKEKVENIKDSELHIIICFAYKDVRINENNIEDNLYINKKNNEYNIENKEINDNNYTCISILVLEKYLSKYLYFDYSILEANNLNAKFFTKNNLESINKLFHNFGKHMERIKAYDARKINEMNKSDLIFDDNEMINDFNKKEAKEKNNDVRKKKEVQKEDENSDDDIIYLKNELNETNLKEYNNIEIYELKNDKNEISKKKNKLKSEIWNLRKYDESSTTNLYNDRYTQENECNEIRRKQYNFLLSHNIFYNCHKNELECLLSTCNMYGKNTVIINDDKYISPENNNNNNNNNNNINNINSSYSCSYSCSNIYKYCNILICNNKCTNDIKEKCDIIMFNKSLYDYIKLKYISNCILMNIKLYIEYNIIFYISLVLFSIISTLVNGLEFLSTVQILYIYIIKNIFFHYISCYRKCNYSVGGHDPNNKYSYNFFEEKDINNIISSILSKIIILLVVFLFGHLFIPENKWIFITDEIRETFEFSEFSFFTDRQQSNFFHTIRSSLRFKKNLENLKIQNNIDIKNDYRTLNEWEFHISPSRHGTIIFNVFFLLFFFSYIYLYIKTFSKEFQNYSEQFKVKKYNYLYFIKKKNDQSYVAKELLKRLIDDINKNILTTDDKINSNNNKDDNNDTSIYKETNYKTKQESKILRKISTSLYNIKNEINKKREMINNSIFMESILENYKIFFLFLFIMIIHIFAIQYGSFFFHFHVNGLTLIQWLFSLFCCLLDFFIYTLISYFGFFQVSSDFFKMFQYLYEPREKNIFDSLNEYRKSSTSHRYKYDLKETRKSWV
ncbi:E1-E2 ATPase, putative [Plasmodium sp. gorilla clade G2]|uniref:E1-E2 ATPase, putative n=1 Tax=Plasmodium sp. gorilla clade G2 TaxID=880535 RepID=UPI000D205121|nr:E1-E2 ATPase, putative [Plasmodium sp. gorilla clade G2]SOV18239.1 E1-E2 ATPase, putative [Plasmodium sp. gorilla clade G2]